METIKKLMALENAMNTELEKAEKDYNNADFVFSATNELVFDLETEYINGVDVGSKLDTAYSENDKAHQTYEDKRYTYEKLKDASIALGKAIRNYCDAMEIDIF